MTTTTLFLIGLLFATGCTNFLLRAFPFFTFGARPGETPAGIQEIGTLIAPGAIAMLVVYCFALYFQEKPLLENPFGVPEWCAAATVLILHVRFRNPLLSITAGTALYMILIQNLF